MKLFAHWQIFSHYGDQFLTAEIWILGEAISLAHERTLEDVANQTGIAEVRPPSAMFVRE